MQSRLRYNSRDVPQFVLYQTLEPYGGKPPSTVLRGGEETEMPLPYPI